VVGLLLALGALGMAVETGDPRWDAVGSLGIGGLLTLIAGVLAREVASLLMGERADPAIESAFREEAATDPQLGEVLRVITVQQGPAQVMIAAKLKAQQGVDALALAEAYNRLEERVRKRCPEVRWQFLEPDTSD
jgi:divalent metal cation (Fe/Co/Zn/Cd) transporter